MNKFILLLVLLFSINNLSAQESKSGIKFFEGSLEQAKSKALTESKPIFIFCRTAWDYGSKKMLSDVLTNGEVGAFFNEKYINLKIDMEKGEGPSVAIKYDVTAYPSMIFINSSGKKIGSTYGVQTVERLIKKGEEALKK